VIVSLDGLTPEDIAASSLQTPPDNERNRRGSAVQGLRAQLFGESGEDVVVEYLDAKDRPQRATLKFASAMACGQSIHPCPRPALNWVKRLGGNWLPALLSWRRYWTACYRPSMTCLQLFI
jgi:hypothetical protein